MDKDKIVDTMIEIRNGAIMVTPLIIALILLLLLAEAERKHEPLVTIEGIVTEVSANDTIVVDDEEGNMWTLSLKDYQVLPGQKVLITTNREEYELMEDKHCSITNVRLTLYNK